jgi:hypothetical protein
VNIGDLRSDLHTGVPGYLRQSLVEELSPDERAAVEAATGEMGNKPDAVKLGWLKMRTKEPWTKQRYATTVGRALAKLRKMVDDHEGTGSQE